MGQPQTSRFLYPATPDGIIQGRYHTLFPDPGPASLNDRGSADVDLPYATFVEAGSQSTAIAITKARLVIMGPQTLGMGLAFLAMEHAASEDIFWHMLVEAFEGVDGGQRTEDFTPGTLFMPDHVLCLRVAWQGRMGNVQWWGGIDPIRYVRLHLEYLILP